MRAGDEEGGREVLRAQGYNSQMAARVEEWMVGEGPVRHKKKAQEARAATGPNSRRGTALAKAGQLFPPFQLNFK